MPLRIDSVVPDLTGIEDLGSATKRWNTIHCNTATVRSEGVGVLNNALEGNFSAIHFSSDQSGSTVLVTGEGAFAQGNVGNYTPGSTQDMHATTWGAFVQGMSYGNGTYGANAQMRATAIGACVRGGCYAYTNNATMRAQGKGSHVLGYAYGHTGGAALMQCTSSAAGSFALGIANGGETIECTQSNALQMGPGSNQMANSISAGTGVRLKGTDGAPGAGVIRNGDVWVQDTNTNVGIRSAGVNQVLNRPTITGSRGGNAALADLLTQLAAMNLIVDSTTA